MADETVIDIKFEPDKKSTDASKKSVTDMVSLIADLGIISKVAGEAMGKLWDTVGKSIDFGVKSFQTSMNALVRGFDASGFNKLTEAMSNIGAKGQEGAVVNQMNALLRSVLNPETGEKNLVKIMKSAGTFKVNEKLTNELITLMKSENTEGAMMKAGEIINSLGTKGSEFADAIGLSSLATLENNKQWADFQTVMNSNSIVYEQNTEALDLLNDSVAEITGTMDALKRSIAEDFAPVFDTFSNKFREWTEKYLIFKGDLTEKADAYLESEQFEEDKKNPNYGQSRYMPNTYEVEDQNFLGNLFRRDQKPPVELSSLQKLDNYAQAGYMLSSGSGMGYTENSDDYADRRMSELMGTTINVGGINLTGIAGAEEAAEIVVQEMKAMLMGK